MDVHGARRDPSTRLNSRARLSLFQTFFDEMSIQHRQVSNGKWNGFHHSDRVRHMTAQSADDAVEIIYAAAAGAHVTWKQDGPCRPFFLSCLLFPMNDD